jgi:hypothetical protein
MGLNNPSISSSSVVPLETKTGTTGVASLDYTSKFSTNYIRYRLVGSFQAGAGTVLLKVNADATAGNYSDTIGINNRGTSTLDAAGSGAASPQVVSRGIQNAQQCFIDMWIDDPVGLAKPIQAIISNVATGVGNDTNIQATRYNPTGAITQLTLTAGAGNISNYSVTLYGYKGA